MSELSGLGVDAEQRCGRHDLAGLAIAALGDFEIEPGLLHVEPFGKRPRPSIVVTAAAIHGRAGAHTIAPACHRDARCTRRTARCRSRIWCRSFRCRSPPAPERSRNGRAPSSTTLSQTPVSTASSRSRPIIGTCVVGRSPAPVTGRSGEPRLDGQLLSLRHDRLGGRYSIDPRVLAYVSSPTRTAPTGAADCRRAAVFTTSPATSVSPCSGRASSATIASPVFTATRS